MTFTTLDIVFMLIILLAAIRGAIRGFVKEVGSTAALILGIAAAVFFSGTGAQFLADYIGDTVWTQLISFLIIFIIVYLVVKLFQNALSNLVERINLEKLDHALGLFVGIAEGTFLVFIVLFLLNLQPFFDPAGITKDSFFVRMLQPLLPYAAELFNFGQDTADV
jgi:membrane protein required for colicin V production